MNYKEIKEVLKNNDYKEVIKGILAFELNIENDDFLQHAYDNIYMGFDDNYLLNESFYEEQRKYIKGKELMNKTTMEILEKHFKVYESFTEYELEN